MGVAGVGTGRGRTEYQEEHQEEEEEDEEGRDDGNGFSSWCGRTSSRSISGGCEGTNTSQAALVLAVHQAPYLMRFL